MGTNLFNLINSYQVFQIFPFVPGFLHRKSSESSITGHIGQTIVKLLEGVPPDIKYVPERFYFYIETMFAIISYIILSIVLIT